MSDMERPIDVRDYIDAVLRRWLLFVILVPLFGLGGIFVAYVLPPVYEARARILVESQAISQELVRSTVTSNAAERLKVIEQRLLTRRNLLQVIDDLDVFRNETSMTPTEKVEQLRGGTSIQPVATGRDDNVTAFTITYQSADPEQAAAIVNEFVALALEENVQARSRRAAETKDFFAAQADRQLAELQDLEETISQFKQTHSLSLPGTLQFREGELSNLQSSMFDRERELLQLEESRRQIQLTLDTGISIESVFDQLSEQQRELRELERQLLVKRAVFAESHPQVRSLVARIDALEAALGPQAKTRAEELIANRRGELERELALINNRRALLEKQQSDALSKQQTLREAISKAPEVEIELAAMERRYEGLAQRYEETRQKLAFAQTGEELEVNRQAERFEVIEQAERPSSPIAPNRRLISASGFAGGIAAAFALIIFAELVNQSVRTASDLERSLNLRPVVTIPYIETEQEVRRRVWRLRIAILTGLIVIPSMLYAIDQYYLPLELLIERVLERTGVMGFLETVRERLAR
ncbi:MAG: Wzz/FepE/Etk N-terminal domain-containing protein [Pseudomonadota bacterium]